jgi:demethylmenaquinone methyltransferase/2-methoxy-6-polyprenyl-1,4-benzoquinol methylase
MTDATIYIQRLLEANPLREPLLRSIVQSLQLPPGSHGLDAGCGIGLQTLLLAEAVGLNGSITGCDVDAELLAFGEQMVEEAGLSNEISFRQADVNCLPFDDNTFDWIWSADCIGYPAGELASLLQELIRVIKPGGRLILLAWSSQQLLPGYPLLEARLNGTCSGYIPFLKEESPDANFMRALQWFRSAGLEQIQARTFVRDIQSPLSNPERTALLSLFDMLWGTPQLETSSEDWEAYQRLCNPGSANFILDLPGYYVFFTYSVFQGTVPRAK